MSPKLEVDEREAKLVEVMVTCDRVLNCSGKEVPTSEKGSAVLESVCTVGVALI